MRCHPVLILLAITPVLCWGPPAWAWQTASEKDLDKVARDQRAIGERLVRLESKMARLSERLEGEGKARAASLLRKATDALSQANLRNEIDQLSEDLEQGHLQAIERQQELLKQLEEIYAILLDRNDLEKLNETLDQIREGIRGLETLADAEGRLRQETESKATSPAERLDRVRAQLEELITKQSDLSAETAAGGDGQALEASRRARERMGQAEEAQQRALEANLKGIGDALEEPLSRLGDRLEEAIRHQEQAAAGLETLSGQDAADQTVVEQLAAEQEAAAKAAGEARDALDEARTALENKGLENKGAVPPELEAVSSSIDEARQAMAGSGKQLERQEIAEAASSSRRAAEALGRARESLEAMALAKTPGEARDAQDRADKAREAAVAALEDLDSRQQDAEPEPSVAEARGDMAEASEQAGRAGERLEEDRAVGAARDQKRAVRALSAAREALVGEIARQDEARREEVRRLAGRQDLLRAQAEQLAGDVERLDQALGEAERNQARDALDRAARSMAGARQGLADQKDAEARSDQQAAGEALEEARNSLAQARSDETPEDARERAEVFEELARQQAEIEQATRELMRRLQDLKGRRWQDNAEQGRQAMGRAQSHLEQQEDDAAVEQEREAESRLRQAAEKLRDDERNYESLRQEEFFFRIKAELTKLRDRQVGVISGLDELQSEQEAQEGRLRRAARRRARDLGGEEKAISQNTGDVEEKIREDRSQVFAYVLKRNVADLDEVAEALDSRNPEINAYTVGVASSVRRRFDELLTVLDEELERRREASRQQQGQPQQQPGEQPKPRLVPPVAELLMIRRLEVGVREEIRIFLADNAGSKLDEVDFDVLQHLGHDHNSLTELFDKLVEAAQQGPGGVQDGEKPPDESESGSKEGGK